MPLADDLRALADRSRKALIEGHDYFTFSKRVWVRLEADILAGRTFTYINRATGSRVNQHQLSSRVSHYIQEYLRTAMFLHFVSLFEDFVFDLLCLWLAAYPGSLAKKQVEFGLVLQAPDKAALTLAVVDRELNELKYESVAEWFAYLERLAKLGCPTPGEVEQLAEIKASRDILTHNKRIANAIYVSKAGALARCPAGERLDISERYLLQRWELIRKMIGDVSASAITKAQRSRP